MDSFTFLSPLNIYFSEMTSVSVSRQTASLYLKPSLQKRQRGWYWCRDGKKKRETKENTADYYCGFYFFPSCPHESFRQHHEALFRFRWFLWFRNKIVAWAVKRSSPSTVLTLHQTLSQSGPVFSLHKHKKYHPNQHCYYTNFPSVCWYEAAFGMFSTASMCLRMTSVLHVHVTHTKNQCRGFVSVLTMFFLSPLSLGLEPQQTALVYWLNRKLRISQTNTQTHSRELIQRGFVLLQHDRKWEKNPKPTTLNWNIQMQINICSKTLTKKSSFCATRLKHPEWVTWTFTTADLALQECWSASIKPEFIWEPAHGLRSDIKLASDPLSYRLTLHKTLLKQLDQLSSHVITGTSHQGEMKTGHLGEQKLTKSHSFDL